MTASDLAPGEPRTRYRPLPAFNAASGRTWPVRPAESNVVGRASTALLPEVVRKG